MKPLTRHEADLFFSCVAQALLEEVPDQVGMVVAAHEEDGATLVGFHHHDDSASLAAVDQLIAQRPKALAAALAVKWTNAKVGPTEPSWLIVLVVPGRTAQFSVKRHGEQQWWRLKPIEAPWLALSTAGALRAALEDGAPLILKAGKDSRLFNTPGVMSDPWLTQW